MLVRFRSSAGDITLFGEPGVQLLRMMGQSGALPGALLARDIPAALAKLERAVAVAPAAPPADGAGAPGREDEPKVSIRQRAWPLIELMRRCVKKECDLIWEQERPLVPPRSAP